MAQGTGTAGAMAATEIGAGTSIGEGGRYRLQRLLGTGGMASVWLAADSRLERDVAVKFLADVLALDEEYVARFEREARLAASLSHPHLVSIFDFSAHGTRPYLVLEFVAGGTLAARLRSEETDWDAMTLARELLDAISYIHGAGILHRDIKPANVLIGTDGRARLTDFGIAQPSGATRITSTGLVVGTHRYLAPEILQGRPADERSDLFACGVLLGECVRPGTSRQLQRLVEHLTDPDPQRRPRSAAEAILLLHEPVTTRTRPLARPAGMTRTRVLPRAPVTERPRVTGTRWELPAHLTPRAAAMIAGAGVLALVLVLLLTAGGGGGAPPTSTLVAPPITAPLRQQLSGLDQAIAHSRP